MPDKPNISIARSLKSGKSLLPSNVYIVKKPKIINNIMLYIIKRLFFNIFTSNRLS